MPLTYCACACTGKQVHMELDLKRPGKYRCSDCGAPEEVVWETMNAVQEEYTKTGRGFGFVPESLLSGATLIEENGEPRVIPFREPWVEGPHDSGRSLKELAEKHREIVGHE